MDTGIYKITNKITNKVYIGSSRSSIKHRWLVHKSLLNRNKHHSRYLQNSFNKHGIKAFKFEIIEEINSTDKTYYYKREQFWIDSYKSYTPKYGYNESRVSNTNGKTVKIRQYDISGNYLKTWDSISEVCIKYDTNWSNITCSLRKGYMAVGYQWRYESDNIDKLPSKNIKIVAFNDKEEYVFDTLKEASEYFNISSKSNINRSIKYNRTTAGYYWKKIIL